MHRRNVRGRISLLVLFTVLSILWLLPSLPVWKSLPQSLRNDLPGGSISLGLDLRGGMSLTLQVLEDKAVSGTLDEIASALSEKGVKPVVSGLSLSFPVPNPATRKTILDWVSSRAPYLQKVTDKDSRLSFLLPQSEVLRIKKHAMTQAMEVIRNRIDQFGVAEPVIEQQGKDRILIQLPGVTDPERAMALIGKTARLEFKLADDSADPATFLNGKTPLPAGEEILYGNPSDKGGGRIPYLLKSRPLMSGDMISDARVAFGQFNEPYVSLTFNSSGSKLFDQITRNHVKQRLAIVLDKTVYSAPVIQEEISGGQAQITGSFSMKEAKDLAIVLRSGALPAPVRILQNVTVGPSLGKDSIRAGLHATMIALVLVLLFMAIYYRFSGVVADFALMLNMLFLMGAMAALHATLTLPGIAGIILTVGMGVDSNVLIFERIREEIRSGRPVRSSIDAGYDKAFLTIVDSHVTTLITAVILFMFGTGPIKGFAVTLTVGIAINLFTSLAGTRIVFDLLSRRSKLERLSI
ncbi:MAG: protein translocase subunit SecD [Nitrospiraceae bacterium]|nr:protein translocase subunit SecD [Nitrospiraceae bacterium]